jgi:type I restriction enzyme M protein
MAKDNNTAAPIGFESDLWRAADALRSNMDALRRVQARRPRPG